MTGHLRDGRIKLCGVGESRVVVLVKNLKQLTFAAAFHPHDVVRDVGYPVDHCELRDRVNQTTAAAVGPGVFVHAKKCVGAPLRCVRVQGGTGVDGRQPDALAMIAQQARSLDNEYVVTSCAFLR